MTKYSVNNVEKELVFLPKDAALNQWNLIEPFYNDLINRDLNTEIELRKFLTDRSELESNLSENFAWRYIKMTCNTADKEAKAAFDYFVTEIQPQLSEFDDALNAQLLASPAIGSLTEPSLALALKGIKISKEIFSKENIPLFTQIQNLSSQYQAIMGGLTIEMDGKTITLQQAANYLENENRAIREEAYKKTQNRRLVEREKVDAIFDEMLVLRHKIAQNAGFENFRDYTFASLKRFDYTQKECFQFHDAVEVALKPILNETAAKRKQKLGFETLKPWDKAVDIANRPALKPFDDADDLLQKSIDCFQLLNPFLADCLVTMKTKNRFDLDSRIGKAPGGYNYPLEQSGFPFIFMNASGLMRDVITMLHEGGHAVHSILTKDLELNLFRGFPSEVAELASMTMELITMEHWHVFFEDKNELKRAKIQHLEDIITTLPWVATIDKFQHWIYQNPICNATERTAKWKEIYTQFSDNVTDWTGQEAFKAIMWHRQLHVFELPFYYIEYGIAQLGAIAIWKNFKQNPDKALDQYLAALSLGYTKPIKEIYETAGITFDFSESNIKSLMAFVKTEIENLNR